MAGIKVIDEDSMLNLRNLAALVLLAALVPKPALAHPTATYYSDSLIGRKMANGRPYNPHRMTAAHRTYRFGTRLRVTNRKTGKSVVVVVTDRCACSLDLSRAAFERIGKLKTGRIPVTIQVLK